MNILTKPIITERSIKKTKKGFYTFGVCKKARKEQIKKVIEEQFNVNVIAIKTIKMPKKSKRFLKTGRITTKSEWKKAIVKIKSGEKIPLFDVTD